MGTPRTALGVQLIQPCSSVCWLQLRVLMGGAYVVNLIAAIVSRHRAKMFEMTKIISSN